MELMMAHMNQAPISPSAANPDATIPAKLEQVILRSLAKFPNDRYPSAAAMAEAIEAAL